MKKLAYFTSKILFYLFSVILAFIFIFSILSFIAYQYHINIPFVEIIENKPKVFVPLLRLRINIPLNYSIILMWLVMVFYAIYFYAFKEFLKIFEIKSLKSLRLFLILNLIPFIYIIIFIGSELVNRSEFKLHDDYFIVVAHLVIAFLTYLYLYTVKKGKVLQEENDLTI